MGLFYTKRNDDEEKSGKTISVEEFVNRMTSMNKRPQQQQDPPKTETR